MTDHGVANQGWIGDEVVSRARALPPGDPTRAWVEAVVGPLEKGSSMESEGEKLAPKEVAARMNVTIDTVYRWVRHGQIHAVKIGSTIRIDWPLVTPTGIPFGYLQ